MIEKISYFQQNFKDFILIFLVLWPNFDWYFPETKNWKERIWIFSEQNKRMRHAKIYVPKLKRPAVERKKSYVLTFGTYVRQNAPTLKFMSDICNYHN